MQKNNKIAPQITPSNNLQPLKRGGDSLGSWIEAYFKFEITTTPLSQREQARDLQYFLKFLINECGNDNPDNWTPRLSADYKNYLRECINTKGERRWGDRTINRMTATLKTFAKWLNKHRHFVLGNPMEKIKTLATASLLEIDKALTSQERRRILDAADLLLETGGLSRDRKRYKTADTISRPKRKNYRPWRNRAMIYCLTETGMRRAAITKLRVEDVGFDSRTIKALEKGDIIHEYSISREGLAAIRDYIEKERGEDDTYYNTNTLFLPARGTQNKTGVLNPNAVNEIWDHISQKAGVTNRTPHSARHAMGRHIIAKTGNIAAVQRQLGHKNAAYSIQYSRVTKEEMDSVINDR